MPETLPRLRNDLDIMPSPVEDRPGLLIRDPFQYTESAIILPPLFAQCLQFFDGQHTDIDMLQALSSATGDVSVGGPMRDFIKAMRENGFLESEEFAVMKDARHREFGEAPHRPAAHAGSGYPDEPAALKQEFEEYGAQQTAGTGDRPLRAIAAPHVSPFGGYASYAAAYNLLSEADRDKTFIVLGTSHYGEPERFGLTRKGYQSPLGTTATDPDLIDELENAAPESVQMEDYCHATEHSIEFQCVFLQHALNRADVKVVPILCGTFLESLVSGKAPETRDSNRQFFEALAQLAEERREDLVWVLGIDMAHIGRRYGDGFEAKANEGQLNKVHERDQERIGRMCDGDAAGYFDLVHPNRDDLRWCGYSPVYTFLKSVPNVAGQLIQYEQWNIDEASVVTFAGMGFYDA